MKPRVARNELLWGQIAAAKNPAGVLAVLTPTRSVRRRSRSRFRVAVAFGALCPNRMFSQPSLVVCAMWAGTRGSTCILQGYNLGAQSCEERATLGADRGGKKSRRGFGSPHPHTCRSSSFSLPVPGGGCFWRAMPQPHVLSTVARGLCHVGGDVRVHQYPARIQS
jgi:hypothetical protein